METVIYFEYDNNQGSLRLCLNDLTAYVKNVGLYREAAFTRNAYVEYMESVKEYMLAT